MIGTRARRRFILGALRSLILMVLMVVPALADSGEPPSVEPLGSDSVRQRVRDRERMQVEYEAMREDRARQLAAARERAAAAVAGVKGNGKVTAVVPLPSGGLGGSGPGARVGEAAGGATPAEEGAISLRTVSVYAAFILIWFLIWLSLMRRRGDLL